MFAIMNIKTNEFLYGTDRNNSPWYQKTSKARMLTYPDKGQAFFDFCMRKCDGDFRVVELETVNIKRVLTTDNFGDIPRAYKEAGETWKYPQGTEGAK